MRLKTKLSLFLVMVGIFVIAVSGLIYAGGQEFDIDYFNEADIDWRQFEGSNLNIMANQHWFIDAMKNYELVKEFEDLTGINVALQTYPEDAYWTKILVSLSAGSSSPDLYMVGSKELGQYAAAGYCEPLAPYLNNSELTDEDWYDSDDIIASAMEASSYEGTLYAMPITMESQILYYRKDIFEEKGLSVPETYAELYKTAKKLDSPDVAGYVTRGARGLHIFWEWIGFLLSYGEDFIDESGKAVFNSPEGLEATEMFVKLLQDAGPKGVSSYTWMEASNNFAQGKSAMYVDATGLMSNIENPDKSKVAGKVGYAMLPQKGNNPVRPNYWYWKFAINSSAANKKPAYLFLEFITSKEASHQIAMYGASTARASVWKDEDFQSKYSKDWANATLEALEAVDANAVPYKLEEFPEIVDKVSIALSNVLTGKESAKTALDKSAKEVNNILGQ